MAGRISRPLRHNGQPYSGVNVLNLWMTAEQAGYVSPYFLTFRQAKDLGGHVRKGEHATEVVYASTFKKTEKNDAGEEIEQEIPFLRTYQVFCAEQCSGLPQHFYQLIEQPKEKMERIDQAERFFASTKADIRYGGNRAFYSSSGDFIQMPPFEVFKDAESYASTLCHELVHFTKHPSRLNRNFGGKRFGDSGYAVEEMVAEIGAAFLSADLSITPEVRDDHASYIDHWIKVLRADSKAVFTAASHASKAAEFLHGLQPIEKA